MFFIHGLITKVNISLNVLSIFGLLFYGNWGCTTVYFLDARSKLSSALRGRLHMCTGHLFLFITAF